MAGLVSEVSGKDCEYIWTQMPLRLVFAFEHMYYLRNGYTCTVMSYEQSLEDLMSNI